MTDLANARITDYYTESTFNRIRQFAEGKETPFVVIDTATIDYHYNELVEGFPYAQVYYAVKANPAPQVLTALTSRRCTSWKR
jgi:ornithine decarboxylase